MGCPLRKFNQPHFCIALQSEYLQYPHHARFRIRPLPKRMKAQGFVSKNGRLEKAGRQTASRVRISVI
jgi:hypothetical protein